MATAPVAPAVATVVAAPGRNARLVGVDIARCLALLGMMATHILPNVDPSSFTLCCGSLSTAPPLVPWHQQIAGGRSAALFAVLAGVSLALVTGREQPLRGRRLAAARVGIALRAGVIACIGLALGGLDSRVAVILVYYGLLFVLALPFLGLDWRVLGALAIGWALLAPMLSHLIRAHLPTPSYQEATFDRLVTEPHLLLADLTFTGYYPAVPWLAYVLAGLAAGRLPLDSRKVARDLALGGGALALGTWVVSRLLTHNAHIFTILQDSVPRTAAEYRYTWGPGSLDLLLTHGFFGTTPTTSWWWLSIVAPHSTTPFDLLHTIGTSLLLLGLALMLGQLAPRVLAVVFAAGTMTLTLYTLHVLALIGTEFRPSPYWFHVGFTLLFGVLWRAGFGQGPLERVTAWVASLGSAAVLALPRGRDRAKS